MPKEDILAKQEILKQDYEYLLNREKKITSEKEYLLDKLIELKKVLSKVS